ncbi:MAG: hypothetical protein M3319_03105, partial [Actinomycetota bacterium]|nr:hypothetical protein [Actinomycetota bacterium]
VLSNPYVSFVVDGLLSVDPWRVRGVEVRGVAEHVSVVHRCTGSSPRCSPPAADRHTGPMITCSAAPPQVIPTPG